MVMHLALRILSLTFLIYAVWAMPLPPNPPGHDASELGLVRLVFNSRLTMQNPELSMSCFATYTKSSNAISDNYNNAYKACIQTSANARGHFEKQLHPEVDAIFNASNAIIKNLKTCNEFKSSIDIVNCHVKLGSHNTQSSYTIAANSSLLVTKLQESNRLIAINEEQCTSAAERGYVRNTTLNYDQLQDCLDIQKYTTTTEKVVKFQAPMMDSFEGVKL